MFDWYKIFNLDEFDATGLISKAYTLNLEGIGQKTIMVFKGVNTSIQYDGITLSIGLNGSNPFEFEDHAVYMDPETNDIYLGIAVDED